MGEGILSTRRDFPGKNILAFAQPAARGAWRIGYRAILVHQQANERLTEAKLSQTNSSAGERRASSDFCELFELEAVVVGCVSLGCGVVCCQRQGKGRFSSGMSIACCGGYFNQTTYTNFSFTIDGNTYPLSGQQVVAQGFVSASCPNYTEPSSLPLTLPNTNNSSVPAGECVYTFSNGNGSSDCPTLTTNTIDPYFKVVSILYAPPGNQSTEGLTQTITDGASTTIGQNFTFGEEFTFSDGIRGVLSGGASFGFANTSSNSSAFTQTWSNAQGMVNLTSVDDPLGVDCLSNPQGTPCKSYSDIEDHELDNFYVWLNPELTVTTTTDNVPVSYTTGYQSVSGVSQPVPDIIPVKAIQMEPSPGSITSANPTGTSSVPVGLLIPQGVSINGTNTSYYEPGLAILCKHLIQSEYNARQCTQQDQCGCTPADFAQILVQDSLLRFNPATLTDNPLSSDVSPLTIDASGESTCAGSPDSQGHLQVDPGSDCRFVVVPSSSTDPTPVQLTLS